MNSLESVCSFGALDTFPSVVTIIKSSSLWFYVANILASLVEEFSEHTSTSTQSFWEALGTLHDLSH